MKKSDLEFLGWVAAGMAGALVFLYSTFASKEDVRERISVLYEAVNRIDQRTWESLGKPHGEPPPPRLPAGR